MPASTLGKNRKGQEPRPGSGAEKTFENRIESINSAVSNPDAEHNSARKKPTHEEIARLAHYLFEERGGKHGNHVEDWLAAEAHLCTDERHSP